MLTCEGILLSVSIMMENKGGEEDQRWYRKLQREAVSIRLKEKGNS